MNQDDKLKTVELENVEVTPQEREKIKTIWQEFRQKKEALHEALRDKVKVIDALEAKYNAWKSDKRIEIVVEPLEKQLERENTEGKDPDEDSTNHDMTQLEVESTLSESEREKIKSVFQKFYQEFASLGNEGDKLNTEKESTHDKYREWLRDTKVYMVVTQLEAEREEAEREEAERLEREKLEREEAEREEIERLERELEREEAEREEAERLEREEAEREEAELRKVEVERVFQEFRQKFAPLYEEIEEVQKRELVIRKKIEAVRLEYEQWKSDGNIKMIVEELEPNKPCCEASEHEESDLDGGAEDLDESSDTTLLENELNDSICVDALTLHLKSPIVFSGTTATTTAISTAIVDGRKSREKKIAN